MAGIIFIIVGIVAAIIGIVIAFREIEDFLGFFCFSLPGIVSIIIGVILKINHLTMNDETVFGVGIALLGTIFFTISALDIH
jgi:flagellar motor component MotA